MTHTKCSPYAKISIILHWRVSLLRLVGAHLVSLILHGQNGSNRPAFE
jgi:hypothetical protein